MRVVASLVPNAELHGWRSEPLLSVSGLSVDYGAGPEATHAVREVDLVIGKGEVVGLAGESGSGKTTLVYAATRLLRSPARVTGGSVRYFGPEGEAVEVLSVPERRLREIRWAEVAIVFQSAMNALNPVIDIGTQLTDAVIAHRGRMEQEERVARARELLEIVGIDRSRVRSFPHELSGGQRQRVMIAMALALEPRLIIMDEPTTALDVVTQRQILEEVSALRERFGFSILFVTHDLSLLIELADRIAVMYGGRIVEEGPAEQIYRAPGHPYTLGLLSSFPPLHGRRSRLVGIPGSPPDLRGELIGCMFAPRCSFAFGTCHSEDPPLEEVSAGRWVACHLHGRAEGLPVALASSVAPGVT